MRYTITVVVVFGLCAPVGAQTTSEYLSLERTATAGAEVVVRDDKGGDIRGRLVGIDDDVLEVLTRGGPRWVALSRVSRVTQPGDSIMDGVFRGISAATAWCVLACQQTEYGDVRASKFLGHVAIGGLVGGLLDRAINGNRTIYQRRPTPSIHVGLSPRGGSVTLEF